MTRYQTAFLLDLARSIPDPLNSNAQPRSREELGKIALTRGLALPLFKCDHYYSFPASTGDSLRTIRESGFDHFAEACLGCAHRSSPMVCNQESPTGHTGHYARSAVSMLSVATAAKDKAGDGNIPPPASTVNATFCQAAAEASCSLWNWRPPGPASTITLELSRISPPSSLRPSAVSSSRWIMRRSGRAP
jgi:hypothetical protein